MKIVIIQGAFLPVPPVLGGGVEKVWFKIGQEFAAFGHDVVHISRQVKEFPVTEVISGVKHIRVSGYDTPSSSLKLKWLDFLYSRRAVKEIPADTDIVITNTFWSPLLISHKKHKVYVDVQRMPKGQMKFYRKAFRLRANSSSVSTAILKEIPGKYSSQVVMIPNPLTFTVSEMTDFNAKQKIVLYVGRVHPEKGLEILINAFKQFENDWTLKIVGPWEINAGGGGDQYINKLRKMAEGSRIEFVGPVFNADALNNYYKEATVFIYPSVAEQGETFGLAPLEAMAWGCAPVVSDLACFRDFIINGQNGLVFDHRSEHAADDLAGKIKQLEEDERLCRTLAGEAVKVRQSHSTKAVAGLFLKEFISANK